MKSLNEISNYKCLQIIVISLLGSTFWRIQSQSQFLSNNLRGKHCEVCDKSWRQKNIVNATNKTLEIMSKALYLHIDGTFCSMLKKWLQTLIITAEVATEVWSKCELCDKRFQWSKILIIFCSSCGIHSAS